MNIRIKKVNKLAKLPYRATEGRAGADLLACLDTEKGIDKAAER